MLALSRILPSLNFRPDDYLEMSYPAGQELSSATLNALMKKLLSPGKARRYFGNLLVAHRNVKKYEMCGICCTLGKR